MTSASMTKAIVKSRNRPVSDLKYPPVALTHQHFSQTPVTDLVTSRPAVQRRRAITGSSLDQADHAFDHLTIKQLGEK